MSVLANTLNAYAAKIKAQRKAAEREAQLALRRKSEEQRQADKLRFEQAKAQKLQKEYNKKYDTDRLTEQVLDRIIIRFKEEHNLLLLAGERAKITKDLKKITKLFFYVGPGRMYLKVNAYGYSKTAYEIMISTLATIKLFGEDLGIEAIKEDRKMIVIIKENDNLSVCIAYADTELDDLRDAIKQKEHMRKEYA